jgi:hypothetical protein
MAVIRSSLPSRKKFKGRKLSEKLGVKIGMMYSIQKLLCTTPEFCPDIVTQLRSQTLLHADDQDENALQIGGTRYVMESQEEEDRSKREAAARWKKAWRFKGSKKASSDVSIPVDS